MHTSPKKDPSRASGASRPRQPNALRCINLDEWDDGCSTHYESEPSAFDEPFPYRFQHGDCVWIHSTGYDWHQGRISGQPKVGKTMRGEGLFWPVTFDGNKRKYTAPLNGELKPDTPHTRHLLEEAGIL